MCLNGKLSLGFAGRYGEVGGVKVSLQDLAGLGLAVQKGGHLESARH